MRHILSRLVLPVLLITSAVGAIAQSSPKFELINTQNGNPLPLVELHSSVRVIGDHAVTTLDMTFLYSAGNEIIEGQIDFELPAESRITRFAMDVNGVLREGVVVEKEKGARTYETIVAKQVDPGLMEMVNGQEFRARVYPIPSGSEKRVVIAWEEKLKYRDGDDFYQCPLRFSDELRLFTFEAFAESQPFKPSVQGHPLGQPSFKRKGNAYYCKIETRNYTPNTPISILFPVNPMEPQIFLEPDGDSTWFYIRDFTHGDSQDKHLPKRILLLWDVSLSGLLRDHDKELKTLDFYLDLIGNVEVELVTFANRIIQREVFEIKNGQWQDLRILLETVDYDGASLPSAIHLSVVKCDEVLLFSDGGCSYGNSTMQIPKVPVFAFASSPRTNQDVLNDLCIGSGGKFIDLSQVTARHAINSIQTEEFRFISAKFPRGRITNLFPRVPTSSPQGFTLAGVMHGRSSKLELRFGYGSRITEKLKYNLYRPESHKTTKDLAQIHARKRLEALQEFPELNKAEITELGIKNQMITPFTSLIVLEKVEDYVKYDIPPPVELMAEYQRQALMRDEATVRVKLDSSARQVERVEEILYDYMDRVDWYEAGFDKAPENSGWLPEERERFKSQLDSLLKRDMIEEKMKADPDDPFRDYPAREGVLRGRVTNQDGLPLPGAVVRIPGTGKGSYTDQEGRFFIRIDSLPENAVLQIKGFDHYEKEIPILDFQMDEAIELRQLLLIGAKDEIVEKPGPATIQAKTTRKVDGRLLQPDSNYIPLPEGMVYVLDGVVQDTFPLLRNHEIISRKKIETDRALFHYGMQGLNGMLFLFSDWFSDQEKTEMINAGLQFPAWDSTRPYLDSIRRTFSIEKYSRYVKLRDQFGASPAFYADMAAYFLQIGQVKGGLRILSNLAEFDLESPEVLRTLAFTLQINGQHEEALSVLMRVWEEFPEEPQSWRDLGLAYAQVGRDQEAVNVLDEMLRRDWSSVEDLYEGIGQTALAELNAILASSKKELQTDHIDQRVVYRMPVPLRITVDWNRFDTDVDLYLVTPEKDTLDLNTVNEASFPGTDMVDGYGPEEILLLKASPGAYKLLVDYYDDAHHNEMGPTLIKITITQNFGAVDTQSQIYGFHLNKEADYKEVARFRIQ